MDGTTVTNLHLSVFIYRFLPSDWPIPGDAVVLNIGCHDEFLRANRLSAAQSKCFCTAVQIYSGKWCHTGFILEHGQMIKNFDRSKAHRQTSDVPSRAV